MPKWKEAVKNIVSNKHERAKQCSEEFSKRGTEVCHKDGSKVTATEVQQASIGRIDIAGEELMEYCRGEFANIGFYPCNELVQQLTSTEVTDL